MKKLFFLVSVLCFHSTLCFAESCTAMPSCAELGYYRGTNIACGDDDSRYITCPYDPDYRKCVNYDCEEMGFIKDGLASLQAWCQNIIFCKKDKSYVLCGDIDGPSTVCVPTYCTAVAVPSNATGTTSCTPQDMYCEYGDPVYTAWECDANYHKNADGTGCDENCVPITCNAVTVPDNARSTATCTPRGSNCSIGSVVDTAWVCNTGYHVTSDGKSCEADCAIVSCGTGVSVPSHAHSTGTCTPKATNCSEGTPVHTGWECNEGYHKNAAGTKCTADCSIVTCGADVEVPSHAHSTGTCTPRDKNCNTGTTVNTGWACNTGWHLNAAGTGCEQDCTVVTCGTGVSVPSHARSTGTCTPKASNCTTGTAVDVGWVCDTNYHLNAAGTGCDADCTVVACSAAVLVPDNAYCTYSCTPRDSNCNTTGDERCTAWECNPTYHKNANNTGCEKNVTCNVVTCGANVNVPSNAHSTGTCTPVSSDCSTGTMVNTGWACNDGYHKNAAGTGCDENETCTKVTCSGVSVPANAQSTGTCTPRETDCSTGQTVDTGWACVSGYHKNADGTGCDLNCPINTCPNISAPSHAHGTGSCTPRYSDCSEETAVPTGWECDNGYHKNAAGTGCTADCAVVTCGLDVGVPFNAHSTGTCTPVGSDCSTGTTVNTGWACNDGYHKNAAGTGCDKDPVCTPKYCGTGVTVPSNDPHAYGTGECTPIYSDCSTGTTVYAGWACESGYHKNAAGTGCEADCSIQTCAAVTVPANAHYTTTCTPRSTDCSEGSSVYTAWACNSGYHTNAAGTGCDKDEDCTQYTQANGWYTSAPSGCYDEGASATCGGTDYTKYTPMDTTCCGEVTLYGSSRTTVVRLKAEWDSNQCKCVDKAKVGAAPSFSTVTSCPGGTHTHVSGQQSNCYKSQYHCFKTGLWCDGYLSEADWVASGNPGGTCGTGKRYSEEDCGCVSVEVTCDNTQGYYNACPTGATCTVENGCQKTTGCAAGYSSSTSGTTPFRYSSTGVSFYKGTSLMTCYAVTGCNTDFYGAVDANYNGSYIGHVFTASSPVTNGSVSCKYAVGCIGGQSTGNGYAYYPSGYSCPSGYTLSTSGPTAGTPPTQRTCYLCNYTGGSSSSGLTDDICMNNYQGAIAYTYGGIDYCGFSMGNTYWDETCCKSEYLSECRGIQNDDIYQASFPGNPFWLKSYCFAAKADTVMKPSGTPTWTILINN